MAKLPEHVATNHLGRSLGTPESEGDGEYGPALTGKCNAKLDKPDGKRRCKNPAGYRTAHSGYGPCYHHFGSTPAQNRNAAADQYAAEYAGQIRFGEVIDTDPMVGILTEVGRSAGFIAFLERKLHSLADRSLGGDPPILVETDSGPQASPLVTLWRVERREFATKCKIASDMGLAAAQATVLEVLGGALAKLVEGVVQDLGHDPHDPQVEVMVQRRLELLGAVGGNEQAEPG